MKVTKAIEILEEMRNINLNYFNPDRKAAIELGVEALKRHRNRDYLIYDELHQLLPGETPEEEGK